MRYLRLRYFDAVDEFRRLAERVNVQGIDCIGGTMMNISEYLDKIGMSGAYCAGAMMDGYTRLLETVGFAQKDATKHVVAHVHAAHSQVSPRRENQIAGRARA